MQPQSRMDGEVLADRYVLQRLLKETDDVRTYAAWDGQAERDVVVKLARLEHIPPATLKRIEHEATVLRRLDSDHIAALLDLGRDAGRVFLVQSFINGVTLEDRLREGALSLREALNVGLCIFTALHDAHDHGVLHRDLKPANIIVSSGAATNATVIDLGLARSDWLEPALSGLGAGTVRYMSPEQAGIIDRDVDARSDLYSAGAVLFECLVGRPLFAGTTLGDVLREHATIDSPDPRRLSSAIPRAIAELVVRLLAKDPEQRYASAAAVLADVGDIAVSIDRGEREPAVVVGLHDNRRTLAEPAFVGRAAEMSTLLSELDKARKGQSGLVLVSSESGGGKTRLLEELATAAAGRGAWILRGQGVDEAAQRPYEVLTGVAADVLDDAQRDRATGRTLRDRIGDRRDAVCASFPELLPVFAPVAAHGGPEAFGERRTLEALCALIGGLGTAERPAVVLLDDCQWADELTLKLLTYRQSREDQPGSEHTVVIAAFRSDEVGSEHPLRRTEPAASVQLGPLEPALVRNLAESMAGPLPHEATDVIVRLAEGSPFMASAVLRGLVETDALVEEKGGWKVDPSRMADLKASRQAAAVLLKRLKLLPPTTLELLSVGAVLGKRFDALTAAALAGRAPVEALRALDEAKRRHILWQDDDRLTFVHDKLRESVLGLVGDEQRQRLHILAAHRYEEDDPEACFDLAYHFDAAGESERALPYALAAAHQARRQHAIDVAQQQYEIAERGASSAPPATFLEIVEGLGDVLTLRGRYDGARVKLEHARRLASDRLAQARIDGKLGDLAFKRRDLPAANEAIERGLQALNRRVPKRTIVVFLACLREIVVQLAHTAFPKLFIGRRRAEGADDEFVAMRLYSRLAHVYWFTKGAVPTFWAHLREMNLAERYGPSLELAQAYSEHAPAMSLIPYYRRGERYGRRSLEIRRELGDTWGQGQSLNFLGVLAYCSSRFEESIECCREAVRLLDRMGDRWEVHTAEENIALALYRLGDLEAAAGVARRVFASGVEIGDAQARGLSLDVWSRASRGRVPAELIRAEIDDPTFDVQTNAGVLLADAVRLLAEDQPREAVDALERARRMVKDAGLRQEYVAPVVPWLATALRQQIQAMPPWDPRASRKLIRRARRVARSARLLSFSFRNNRAHALRESGLLAAMAGRTRLSRRYLRSSIAIAQRLRMRHEHARSLLASARVGSQYGWARSEDISDAQETLRRIESRSQAEDHSVTPSLVDRFDAVLDAGRRIAAALSRSAVYTATHEAALTLLRGERCVVLEVDEETGELLPVEGGADAEHSRTLADRAREEGRPVLLDEDTLDASDSVVLSGVRSALCAPVLVRGRVGAFIYTEHTKLAGLFRTDEERLAEYIATIAGAALENAEGFAEIEELTRTLELRVLERTKELDDSNRRLDKSLTRLQDAYGREREITKKLKRLDELKTDFIAMAAHDLRNPVTVITGFADLLNDQWDELSDDDRHAIVERMTTSTTRLGEFIENLLQFARIESGELSYDIAPFDLAALVHRTIAEQSGSTDRLRTSIELGLPPAFGDEQRSWQVLANLLSNAMKFSPEAEPVEVTVSRSDGSLLVSVRDRGPGIAVEDHERIFEKFGRAKTDKKQRGGTGLGLYITRSIVESQGGRIWVESEPGHGATFSYTIPVAPAQNA